MYKRKRSINFSHVVVSSTEFGEGTVKLSHHFDLYQPTISWSISAFFMLYEGFCSALEAFRLLRFFLHGFLVFIAVLRVGSVRCEYLALYIFCLVSLTVLLFHYFITLTLVGSVLLFGIACLHFVLYFSFGTVCLFAPFIAVYLFIIMLSLVRC